MKKPIFFRTIIWFSLFSLIVYNAAGQEQKNKKHNVIVILADDLGKYDTELYGESCVKTPHINSIAQNGVKFSEAYATAAICSPSRAALLTGKYQQRFGYEFQPHKIYPRNFVINAIYSNLLNKQEWTINKIKEIPKRKEVKQEGLPANELTVAKHFKAHGYNTAIMGKWHLGYSEPSLPKYAGFDEHYGPYEAFSLYAPLNDTSIVEARINDFLDKHIWRNGRKKASLVRHNGNVVDEKGYLTFTIAEQANQFIEKNQNHPFFLYIPFTAPHTPFQAPRKHYDKFCEQDHTKRVYYAMIAALDDAIGSILDKLKQLNLEEETIIVFTSDNGGALYTNATENGLLKGGKFMLFEGGVNVPMAIQWKNNLPLTGIEYNHPVNLCDIFPTVAAAAGISFNTDNLDGVNLLPFISGANTGAPHEAIFWRTGYNKAIRKGDWKLVVDDKNKIVNLYNIREDKFETADNKDCYKEKLDELLHDLNLWDKGLPQPLWPHVLHYKIKINNVEYEFAI